MSGWENFLVASVGARRRLDQPGAYPEHWWTGRYRHPLISRGQLAPQDGPSLLWLSLVSWHYQPMRHRAFAIAAIAVLVWKTGGLYWIVPATLLSIIVAIYNA